MARRRRRNPQTSQLLTLLAVGAAAYLFARKASAAQRRVTVADPYAAASGVTPAERAHITEMTQRARDSAGRYDLFYDQDFGFSSGRDANTQAIYDGGAQPTDYGIVG